MRTIVLAAAIATLWAPTMVLADPPAPTVQSAGAHPGEPLICRYYYYNGRVLPRPTCKTERQWIRERHREQAELTAFQLRALIQQP